MKTTFSKPIELAIDIETYSSVDIKLGAYAYSDAPDFRVLLVAYKFSDEDEVKQIDCTKGEHARPDMAHDRFFKALTDSRIIKTAYNANFERTCLTKAFNYIRPLGPEDWRCTMILAAQLGLPRSLADVGAALGLAEEDQKQKTGRALIQYFCKPCKPTRTNGQRTRNLPMHAPEKWELFKEYNRQDVVTEQAVLHRLQAFRPDESEQELWSLDQRINDRGVLLDTELARTIVDFDEARTAALTQTAREITGLDNPNSLQQLKSWLQEQHIDIETLNKNDVKDLLAWEGLPTKAREVLKIRQALGKTSVKKYQVMLDIAGQDKRARGILQFYGGRTGRWAGKSLQPQNLARNTMPDADLDAARALIKSGGVDCIDLIYGEPSEVFSQLVRTAFIPSKGRRFVVSDFSAIEARVIAWIAGEGWRLDVFKKGGDIYCESASRIYHVPVAKHGPNAELRQRGKVAELALGYGGSIGAMKQMDTSGAVPEDEMARIVKQWRAESPNITRFWRDVEDAAIATITTGKKRERGSKPLTFELDTINDTPVLRVTLPSGRPISYWAPKVIEGERGQRITYMAQNQTTRKWERTETYGGKLTENIVQSVARDCLAEKMKAIEARGYEIVFHVHDEIIVDAPREDKDTEKIIDDIMGAPIDWAQGLPLKGGTYTCDFYRKD